MLAADAVLTRGTALTKDAALARDATAIQDSATTQESATSNHSASTHEQATPQHSVITSPENRSAGCRIYMAVSGHLNLTPVMGSFSTSILVASGRKNDAGRDDAPIGVQGRTLRKGDHIPYYFSRGDGTTTRPIIPSGSESNHGDKPHDASHQTDTNQTDANQSDTNQSHATHKASITP